MAAIVAIADLVIFWHIMQDPSGLTWPFAVAVIIITLIAIVANLWWVIKKYKLAW